MNRYITIIVSIILAATIFSLSGCYWMGKTTAKAENSVERGGQRFEDGYNNNRR